MLERARWQREVAEGAVSCARCGKQIRPGESWDLDHVDGDRDSYLGPAHAFCNRSAAARVRDGRPFQPPRPEVVAERDGLERKAFDVPWLKSLKRVPKNATWPRLMTAPHPRAVGSLGPEFCREAKRRTGLPLRWWQRLVAYRLLEVDGKGRLVWETVVLSTARQVGKSWLLRELLFWRIHQGERFGEPQTVMHTGKDVAIAKDVQQSARAWARMRPETYQVSEANGQEEIRLRADGSRWMLRAQGAVYGYATSLAAVDEAWKVKPERVEEGLTPTMVEREQAQLLLISTAHRMATSLVLNRRRLALEELESGQGDLLIEWSAPHDAELDDVAGWRLASPHWTPKRERLIASTLAAARQGERADLDEADPLESFTAQWLNRWPRRQIVRDDDPLLPEGLWAELAEPDLQTNGQVWVAVEDDYGRGAAVAAVAKTEDERLEVDGWLCADWDAAVQSALRIGESRRIKQLLVGASMLSRVPPGTTPQPEPAGSRETRPGLALFRDLAAARRLAHDDSTDELDEALAQALVKSSPAGGLAQARGGATHLVRAVVWAVSAAHRPARVPAIR